MLEQPITILERYLKKSKPAGLKGNELVIHFDVENKGFYYDYVPGMSWLTKEEIDYVIKQLTQCPTYRYVKAN